jgi:hypothetical protein
METVSVASYVLTLSQDVFNTHPSLGMKSTAGSLALENARPSKNARLVEKASLWLRIKYHADC